MSLTVRTTAPLVLGVVLADDPDDDLGLAHAHALGILRNAVPDVTGPHRSHIAVEDDVDARDRSITNDLVRPLEKVVHVQESQRFREEVHSHVHHKPPPGVSRVQGPLMPSGALGRALTAACEMSYPSPYPPMGVVALGSITVFTKSAQVFESSFEVMG